jgi:hypothetical protein
VAVDHALAQAPVGEVSDRRAGVGPGRGAGHHFQQPHVTRRIEEVGDQEVLGKAWRQTFNKLYQWDGRCI